MISIFEFINFPVIIDVETYEITMHTTNEINPEIARDSTIFLNEKSFIDLIIPFFFQV